MTEDQEPIEQFDPAMQAVQGEPWFIQAATLAEQAASLLAENGVHKGTLFAGAAKLVLDDPIAGALVEVASVPRSELAFVVVKVADAGELPHTQSQLKILSDKVRSANPEASLLVLPGDWSFRTMQPEMAIQFAVNMIAFVSDDELEKIGLRRIE